MKTLTLFRMAALFILSIFLSASCDLFPFLNLEPEESENDALYSAVALFVIANSIPTIAPGSCTESSASSKVCVDYYDGYTVESVQSLCASTGDIWAIEACSVVNTSLTKVPGKCKVIDPAVRTSYTSYYEPDWNLTNAQAHCGAYPAGYTATWVAD